MHAAGDDGVIYIRPATAASSIHGVGGRQRHLHNTQTMANLLSPGAESSVIARTTWDYVLRAPSTALTVGASRQPRARSRAPSLPLSPLPGAAPHHPTPRHQRSERLRAAPLRHTVGTAEWRHSQLT